MRSTIALSLAVAAVAVSAQNCNPSYNVAPSTDCFTGCNEKAGAEFVSGWTMDSSSSNFLPSLKLMCTKGTSEYTSFMTKAGMCMAACTGDDPELFNAEFQGACAWYAQHKDDKCASDATTTKSAAATTTTAAAGTTTTAATVGTTTTAAAGDSAVVTSAATDSIATAASSAIPSVATALSSAVAANSSIVSSAASSIFSHPSNIPTTAASASAPAANAANAAGKLQLSSYAIALVAGASYLAF